MRTCRPRSRSRGRSKHRAEETAASSGGSLFASAGARGRAGAHYAAGPVFGLGTPSRAVPGYANGPEEENATDAAESAQEPGALPTVEPELHGVGTPTSAVAYAGANTIRLQGKTDAKFDGGSFSTADVKAAPAKGCNCQKSPCVHVTGTLNASYSVATTVTLPPVPDGLTPCQQDRVRSAISGVLAPHEQQHVTAFSAYNGSTSTPFDLTLCQSEFNGAIQSMFNQQESARRSSAQAASDALDPFNFDIDLNCTEPKSPDAGAPNLPQSPTPSP